MGPFERFRTTKDRLEEEHRATMAPFTEAVQEQIQRNRDRIGAYLPLNGFRDCPCVADCFFLSKGYRLQLPTIYQPYFILRKVGGEDSRKTGGKREVIKRWDPDTLAKVVVEEAVNLIHLHQFG